MVRFGCQAISKSNFLKLYMDAHQATYTLETILSAFRATGLIPLNPQAVLKNIPSTLESRPITPPGITITDNEGITIQIPITPYNSAMINEHVRAILDNVQQSTSPNTQSRIEQLAKSASLVTAENAILKRTNQDLFQANQQKKNTNKKRIGYKGRVLSVEEATFKREEEERKAAERAEKTAHAAQRAAEKAEKAQRTINRVSKAKPSTAETSPSESEATLAVEGEDNDQPVLGRLFNDDMAFIREEALRKAREGMETVELMLQNHRVSENPHDMKVVDRQRVGGDSESKGARTRSKSKKKVNSAVNIDDC